VMNLLFVFSWQHFGIVGAHAGLALATSLSAWLNYVLLHRALVKASVLIPAHKDRLVIKSVIACAVMSGGLFALSPAIAVWNDFTIGGRLAALIALILFGAGLYVAVLWLLGVRPAHLRAPQKQTTA